MKRSVFYVFSNWKMNFTHADLLPYITKVPKELLSSLRIAPSFCLIHALANLDIVTGAQDISPHSSGSCTSQVSGNMIKNSGASFVIIGHSECRAVADHTFDVVVNKCEQALNNELDIVFCVGETTEERESHLANLVIEKQLAPLLTALTKYQNAERALFIAYEPIWSIGSGNICPPEEANNVAQHIKNVIESNNIDAKKISILYGGSIDSNNVSLFTKCDSIEGVLVGKASNDPEEYTSILRKVL